MVNKTRVSLPPDEWKEEIINSAWHLFYEKGYSNVTIKDIIKDLHIVKGTFYYHFKNKEEVKKIIVNRQIKTELRSLEKIFNNPNYSTLEKLSNMIMEIIDVYKDTEKIHNVYTRNPELFQDILIKRMESLEKIMEKLLNEGIEEKVFNPSYYDEALEFLVVSLSITLPIIHYTINLWPERKAVLKLNVFTYNAEHMLGAKRGSFDNIKSQYWHIVKDTSIGTIKT